MSRLTFDVAHMLAGSLVLVSFLQLYQDRLYALLNVYAVHALVLALSVAWQAMQLFFWASSMLAWAGAASRTAAAAAARAMVVFMESFQGPQPGSAGLQSLQCSLARTG